MKTRIYTYILNFPESRIRKIRLISFASIILFLIIESYQKIGLEISFVFITLNIWIGGGFVISWYIVKSLPIKIPNTVFLKFLMLGWILLLFLFFAGPIFCYCMAKHYEVSL